MSENTTPTQSYTDYIADQNAQYIAKNMSEALYKAVEHELVTPKYILFFEKIKFHIESVFSRIQKFVLDKIYECENFVKIRPAGSMMTINDAMERSAKLKTLKDFGEWIYTNWAKWEPEFNWSGIETFVHGDKPDKRIGWRKTWMVTAPSGTEGHRYPVAFTDKPFYILKCRYKDRQYIRQKYPGLLECVVKLRYNCWYESNVIQNN